MIRKILSYTLAAVLIAGVSWYAYIKLSAADKGDVAPEISGILSDGSTFSLSELRGEYVLVQFWGSWCGPCRKHNKELVEFHRNYSEEIEIVSIALEKEAKNGRIVANRDGFTWKNQIVDETRFVMMSDIAQKYGVSSIPTTFLISPNGILLGEKSLNEVEELLNKDD